MEKRAGPKWQTVDPASLLPGTRKAYDAYLKAFGQAVEAGKQLKTIADDEWDEQHPGGIDSRHVSFNVTNGNLQWAWTKGSKTKRGAKAKGVPVPSAKSSDKPRSVVVQVNDPTAEGFKNYMAHVEAKLHPNYLDFTTVIKEDDPIAQHITAMPDPKRVYTREEAMNPYSTLAPGETGLIIRKFRRVCESDQWQQIVESDENSVVEKTEALSND